MASLPSSVVRTLGEQVTALRLEGELREALTREGVRKIDVWTARYRLVEVDFPLTGLDPFFNANSPADLARAEQALARGQ